MVASSWTLAQIQTKIRQVTGRFTPAEMSNDELKTRINQFYTLTFPAEVKLEEKHVYYEFVTSVNQALYDQPQSTYTNWEPLATANNIPMLWFQDPAFFEATQAEQYTFLNPWTGDGSTTNFTTTVTGFPILPGSLTISDDVELFEDINEDWTTANVQITGSAAGSATINYDVGTVNVTFNTAPLDGQLIHLNYVIFAANRPQAILVYNNQFELWPIPDQAYKIKMGTYMIVTPLDDATDTPDLNEWGPCIAYGTARDILADYGELDGYAEITALYKEQVAYILTRTNQGLLNTRAAPNF